MAGETYDILFNARMRVSDVITSVGQIQKSLQGLTIPKGISDDLEKSFNKLNPLLKDYQKQLSKGFDTKKDLNNFNLLRSKIDDVFGEIKSKIGETNGQEIRFKTDVSEITKMEKELDKATSDIQKHLEKLYKSSNSKESITAGFDELKNAIPNSFSGLAREAEKAMSAFESENFAEANRQIEQMKTHISSMADSSKIKLAESLGFKNIGDDADKAKAAIDKFLNSLQTNKTSASAIERITQQIRELVPNIEQAKIDSLTRGLEELGGTSGNIDAVALAMRDVGMAGEEAGSSILNMKGQVEQLKTSTQYFFSLRNMINLLKRGVDEAVESVKELDAAMTQTAVVTDFSVSDMWEKLPEYTANANALGASVKDMYEATTLYYQQGLNTEQSMSIAAETMKMARIGGLEAADATDKMTAALRGFNMELDEASAKRVNDVYSNLAAKTASDTEELGTAMQRTASIAASAGMSFEGTAAFLAQAIETTREPAENLGTAMKTIVARFTELKKNPLEIAEVDGEEVSYNKVDTALQSIGVSLKDANGQFRDLDQVFLDISQRWNSLTQTQQRYIATTAAGSRQQSRFIAMMSNYDRTVQLMDYANNSAGASNEQFGKTMESLEAKLNKLHNAWQQFEMGIADNTIIKGAVDGLTGVLGLVNKILDKLSLGSSGIKSILSLFTAFTGLKMAGRLANSAIGGLGGMLDPKSSFMEGLKGGMTGRKQAVNNAQAQAISTPIVNKLGEILSAIHNIKSQSTDNKINNTNNRETSKDQYTVARQAFNQLGERDFTINEASQIFSGLDKKHQLSLFNNSPGTRAAMRKASFGWFDSKGLSKELTNEGKQYINSIYKGMSQGQISVDKGIELIGRPDLWGEHFGTETAQAISESFKANAEKADKAAQKGTWRQLNMGGASEEAKKAFLKDSANAKRYNEALAKNYDKAMQGLSGHGQAGGSVTSLGTLANDIGKIGDKFTQAGYGITAFGNVLSQLGGPIGVVGAGLQSLGGIISNLGMTVSGVTSLFNIFSEGISFGGFAIAGAELAAILAPIAAIGATAVIIKKYTDSIKKAGEKVTDTFNKSNKTVEDNISKLKSYQGELATLSKGVDANGNNVNLSDNDYQRYLEIVDSIAEINPKIVKGYNAQGHAIIDNNAALTETLQLQEKNKKEALDEYLDPEKGLQKLINARNVNTDYGKATRRYQGSKAEDAGLIHNQVAPLANDVATVADRIGLIKGFDEKTLQKYGIESLDALKEGEAQAVKNFVKHRDKIESELSSFMAESNEQLDEGLIKSFEKLGENSEAFDEAIKPVYDNLLTAVSQSPLYDSVADEFKDALNIGLKDLASQNLSAKEMSKQANQMLAKFSNLTTGSGKYADAIKTVDKAQEEFAKTLDETEYQADVQPAIDELTRLKEEALKDGTAYGNALAEYLENQIERISRFTEEGSENLTQALNTATNEIAVAEGALESFNEATKTDYFTAAEGMKSIFDKTTETYTDIYGSEIQKHAEGYGDATFWTGADTLLGEKTVDKLTKGKEGVEAVEAISNALKKMEPLLKEGQDGFDAFRDRVLESVPALQDLAGVTWDESGMLTNIPEDQWHNVAEALGISDEMLTSMLNKARQFSDISFANLDDARKALATSEYTIQGTKAQEDGTKNLYVKEETLRSELANAGYVRREQQNEQIEKLLEKGVKTIPAADSMSTKELKSMADDWGVKNLPDLIQKLNETGDFTKEEIQAYADKLGMLGDSDRFDSIYDSILAAADNPELAKQTAELEKISGQIGILINKKTIDEAEKDRKNLDTKLYGKLGKTDSDYDLFAHGKNSEEKALTAGEYETTKKNLIDLGEIYKQQASEAQAMAMQTSGKEQERWKALAEGYDKDYENVQKYLALGEKAFNDSQNKIDKNIEERKSKDIGRSQELKKATEARKQQEHSDTSTSTPKPTPQFEVPKETAPKDSTVVITYEADVDPKLEELNEQYAYDRNTKRIVQYVTKGDEDLQLAEDEISKIDLAAQDPKQVIIEANTNGVTLAQAALDTLPKKKSVTVNLTDNISSKIASIAAKISSLAAKAREVKLNGVAIGQNNYIKHQTIPSFGSAAKGYGTVGPKNKGGLTLTGEKGFEIAWLPSENRSMILGAAGPQMLNLPADAVVYTHEQSEDILKQRAIPAGSHYTAESSSSVKKKTNKSNSNSSSKAKSKSKSKKKSKDEDNTEKELKIVNFSIEETVRFNIEAKLAKLAYEINKRTKTIEKTLSRVGATSKEIEGNIKDQVDALNQQKQANADLLASYQRQTNEIFNWQEQISYQTTETKTTGKGKKKKTTTENVTKTMTINVRDYITQLADGVYGVNEAAVAALGTPELRKGAHDAATSLISSINSGMIKAKEAMDEADEKIEELNSKLYEAFNRWEKSINEIYLISQKLESINKRRNIRDAQIELELTKLQAGFADAGTSIEVLTSLAKKSMNELRQGIEGDYALIVERYKEFNKLLDISTYQELQNTTEGRNKYAAAEIALKLYKEAKGDMSQALAGIRQGIEDYQKTGYANPTDKAVEEVLDTIEKGRGDLYDSIETILDDISNAFDKLIEYQETIKSFEDKLLEGLEEQAEKQVDELSKLNDSISDALKDLLDEVRRKLEARRQAEDNAKTEQDISKKQQRLAALRANTSGGNQVEIKQLEKEIAESQQSYQRTLEDQLLDKLQEQGDQAAKQRERQIELLEEQAETESGTNRTLVELWLSDPQKFENEIRQAWLKANGYDEETARGQALLDAQFKRDFAEVVMALRQTEIGDQIDGVENDLTTIIRLLLRGLPDVGDSELSDLINDLSDADKTTESAKRFKKFGLTASNLKEAGWGAAELIGANYSASELKEAGFTAKDLIDNGFDKNVKTLKEGGYGVQDLKDASFNFSDLTEDFSLSEIAKAFTMKDFYDNQVSYNEAKQTFGSDKETLRKLGIAGYTKGTEEYNAIIAKEEADRRAREAELERQRQAAAAAQAAWNAAHPYGLVSNYGGTINKGDKGNAVRAVQVALNALMGSGLAVDGSFGDKTYKAVKKFQKAVGLKQDGNVGPNTKAAFAARGYKTGGLADYTGPAWLDGTPSKPELVLNATDTKNFIALKDVLSHAMGSSSHIQNSYGGDNIYEININVDKIEKDYDIDKLTERIKKNIVKDSSYRNVTQVSRMR